jgi:hypothetical protein
MTGTSSRPITYSQAAAVPVAAALMRHQLLEHLDLLSKTARRPGRRRHGAAAAMPLTAAERLELLALSERLACHFSNTLRIHFAVLAGATWPQIATALGQTSFNVRMGYAYWADGQRAVARQSPGMTIGFSEAEHTAALAAAELPYCPKCGSGETVWDANDDTSESWHCAGCYHGWVTGGRA